MGSFLQTINQLHHEQPSVFYQKLAAISQPIDRIKQHYGLFKSICDSFLITKDKYLEIFESSKNLNEVWDREHTQKLDALQLFTGLIIHSQATFRQKLKFLFVIFDFNEIRNLSFVDLEYATLCLCNATFKILGKNAKANETQIVAWLKGYFDQKQRVNITKLYSFCLQSKEVKMFFELITKEQNQSQALKDFIEIQSKRKMSFNQSLNSMIPRLKEPKKELQQKLEWHRNFSKKLAVPYNPANYLHRTEMSWVYGVRVQGLHQPFVLIQKCAEKNELELLYTSSTLMILYNIKTNKQRYYKGHNQLISSFVYNSSQGVIISASQLLCSRSIHVWEYSTLQCRKIIDTYKPVLSLSLLGKNGEMLIVICSNHHIKQTTRQYQQSQSQPSTIMIFSLLQQKQYSLLYSYSYDSVISQIANIYTTVDQDEVGMTNVWDSFVAVCEDHQGVVFSEVENRGVFNNHQFKGNQPESNKGHNNNDTYVLKTLPYEYEEQLQSPQYNNSNLQKHDQSFYQSTFKTNSHAITCSIALFINQQNPSLRTLINSEQALSLFIITGHRNGQVKCVVYNQGQFGQQEVVFDCVDVQNDGRVIKSGKKITEVYKVQTLGYNNRDDMQNRNQHPIFSQKSITCLQHTSTHILFSQGPSITIFPFSYLISKEDSLIRTINIENYSYLKLFNSNIRYFTCFNDQIIVVTENQGDFVSIKDRRIVFSSEMVYSEVETVTRIKTLTKIDNSDNHSQSLCILQKPQSSPLIYLTTQDRRVLIINTFTKQVENVWQINSPGDKITVIDSVYTDEDVLYFVCGCQSGKLYIRVDNEENPKFYDCSSQIIDIKISKDAAYLLVATVEKYLYFFTQINKNFSSPRKLHFQNQTPVCINFLDSNKMFTVNTSAKNVYTIEIPQLKHKNVQKESQRISISKMKIMYPSTKGSYESVVNSKEQGYGNSKLSKSGPVNASQKHEVYTKSYLGGELKYFLITLNTGELMFFESRQHLPTLSYVTLDAHFGEIGNLAITEDQIEFYTLGRYDNTLIEWKVKSTRTIGNISQTITNLSQRATLFQVEEFQKLKQISCYYKLLTSSKNDDIYLFKGTKSEKLNQALRKSLSYLTDESGVKIDEIKEFLQGDGQNKFKEKNQPLQHYMPRCKLNLRQPNISLEMSHIYGLQCYKRSSVAFWGDSENSLKILYFSSRYLLSLDLLSSKRQQRVVEQEKHKLSCFVITEQNKILYALAQPNTKIRFHGGDEVLWTTHQLGIVHLAVHKCFILSYGILSNMSYSINLHNHQTKQLISKRTTQLKIHEFIFINQHEFISLNDIRVWKDLYPSEKIGKATAGILMPNHSDVCLGTDNGSISILNTHKGIFTVVTKAHQSDIICITLNKFETNGFELLTVSKDDKINIWNERFNCKLTINLRDQLLKNIKYLPETDDEKKSQNPIDNLNLTNKQFRKQAFHHYKNLNIRGIDSRKGRVLIYLASGEVYVGRFTLVNKLNRLERTVMDENSSLMGSQIDSEGEGSQDSIEADIQKNTRKKDSTEYQKEWEKVIESHCCETQSIFKKSISFAIHPFAPIIASVGGNDKKLLFRNYETSQVIDTFLSQQSRITCLKYSKKGKLLILGFKNGNIKVFSFEIKYRQDSIRGVQLRFSQKFGLKQDIFGEPISIEVSQKSIYFAVSFVGQSSRGVKDQSLQQPSSSNEPEFQQGIGFINIYKLKSQQLISSGTSTYQETYYMLIDTLRIKQVDSSLFSTGKYTRCVWQMAFASNKQGIFGGKLRREGSLGGSKKQKQQKKQQSNSSQINPNESMCLIMYEQYINQNMIKVANSQRDKFTVYLIEEKVYLKRQFEEADWSRVRFGAMVNVLQLNRFRNEMVLLGEGKDVNKTSDMSGYGPNQEDGLIESKSNFFNTNNEISLNSNDDSLLSMTSMCYYKNSMIIYGGTHGKLHLVRLASLITQKNEQNLSQLRQHEMSTCKTYPSQASFISKLQLSSDQKYLFVSGQVDEAIVKYSIQQLQAQSQLDYQEYDTYRNQSPQIYITKEKFYTFINSLSPLREGIRTVLEDVEDFDSERKPNEDAVGLEVMKVIGRRAFDRMNNVFVHQENLIYTLGPNLILQNIVDPFMQKLISSDPNPLSHNPQISTIHMKKHSNILILATQQQSARLFVWDIRAMICLSQMRVNCSIIYGLKFIGDQYAMFYGVNSMYQLVIQVVDWRLKRVVALCNLLHSSIWKIKDCCVLENEGQKIDQNGIKFVTCGVQHLSQWRLKSNTLIERHFTEIPLNTTFTVITYTNSNLILTGCQRGSVYLWKNSSLIHQLKVHSGPIRSIENIPFCNIVLTGGMDSIMFVLRLVDDELEIETGKSLNPKADDLGNTSNVQESSRGERQVGRSQLQQGSFLTEFDIQSIIHTDNITTSTNHHSSVSKECTFFTGTRSGDIYFCEYNMQQKQFISVTQVVYGQDHETIVSATFANKQEVLYTLTSSGKLQVWELTKMERTFSYKFMKSAKKLYIYKQYILVCFEKEIIFIELDIKYKIIKIDQTLTLTFEGMISECILSYSQNYLALGLHTNESNEILIYELSKKNLLYRSPSLKYEIEFLDFSIDQKYLLYKDKFEELGMVYLMTLKRINTIFVEMKLEWQTEGLRISPKAQRIYSSYNCQNRITTIVKLGPNYILVGDQMGTLRVFQYPPEIQKLGELHTQCYTKHMNKINCIKQHRELTYVATTAVSDRSLILWRKFGLQ